ncbi:MAG TPA: HAMP domain-containing protein [Thermoplasmatales archaeon]|nr:HAMP domain-containing protein [Thermoplasmatales archaeon]
MEEYDNNIQSTITVKILMSFFLVVALLICFITWSTQTILRHILIGYNLDRVLVSMITSQFIVQISAITLSGIVIALLMALLISRSITTPILRLRDQVLEISEGNLNMNIDVESDDEITELARAFESMTQKLRQHIETMEQQIEERTKSLQEKINELEMYKKLTVGRELKMIELKKHIQELEERLKEVIKEDVYNT